MKKLVRNAIQCTHCKDIIESKYTHDWKQCSCGKIYIDGGLSYSRIGGEREDFIDLAEYKDDE